jgi:hypothetical protein
MSESSSFRDIQRRTIQLMNFEDGLWDIMLGMIFLALSIYPLTRAVLGPVWNMGLFLAVLALLVVVLFGLRRIVSEPRLGHAKTRRTPKLRLLLIFTAVIFVLTLGLVGLTLFSPSNSPAEAVSKLSTDGRSYLVELITVAVMGVIFSGLGYASGVSRLYIYGWMVGLANLASVYMHHEAGWTFLLPLAIAAGIILIVGAIRFGRFMQKYSPRTEAG